jgi:hypothetical protein
MTSPARIMSGDLLEATYDVEFDGQKFKARRLPDSIEFAEGSKAEPFGYIKFGSPTGGAIWIGHELIGEFEVVGEDFTVTPIIHGQMQPDAAMKAHPITFLLTSYVRGASE